MDDIRLRTPTDADWPAILEVAFAAVPWDAAGNQEWLQNRRAFSGRRRHYVVEDGGHVVGYGALEEGPEPGVFRLFVVMDAERLNGDTGQLVFDQLNDDLTDMKARGAWVREYASDDAILDFFTRRGFVEYKRFTLEGEREMVVLVQEQ